MKLLGAVLLVASGLLLGWGRSKELGERVAMLMDLRQLMNLLATEISFAARPLPEMLRRSESRFCQQAVKDGAFPQDPRGALSRAGETLLKNQRDRSLFRDFAQGLGTTDIQGQEEHLKLCGALLEDHLREARTDWQEKRRLYIAMGLFGGLTLCLVII